MKNDPAFPQQPMLEMQRLAGYVHAQSGLSKREIFAAMAMQGILFSGIDHEKSSRFSEYSVAKAATDYADALIAELEKK